MKKVIVVQATDNQPEVILILTLLSVVDRMSLSNTNGKGVIIHAGTDDLTSQLTDTAGARVSCGVITERVG